MIGDKRGVTLMELMVVMGIFSITVLITSGIFLITNRAQRRTVSITSAQADLRFALEAIVREVRSGRIDFATYEASGGLPIPTQNLFIRRALSGELVEFSIETSEPICPPNTSPCLAVSVDGGNPQALNSEGITIDRLAFYVSPQTDPFTVDEASGLYFSDTHPTVTIVISARTTGVGEADIQTLNIQTTVASRTYVR